MSDHTECRKSNLPSGFIQSYTLVLLDKTRIRSTACEMTSDRNYSVRSYIPTSSDFGEMQPPEMALSQVATKKSSRSREPKQLARDESVEKKERRRQQVLLAQRAYRARNEDHTTALQQRVARLESALEITGQAIISFTDVLVGARVPLSHQHIAHRLRDTVKTCLDSAMYGDDYQEHGGSLKPPDASLTAHTPIVTQALSNGEHEERPLSIDHAGLSTAAATFPALSWGGGAGTHYPEAIVSSQIESGPEQQVSPGIHGALSAFSPEAQKDLHGEWFDLFDLVGYLRAQDIALHTGQ
ncbi:hypothetical protein BDW59DRAFT_167413 [Aspergillus cavernicola]|uniref:BZIP domain-containing protein n=1 Tax=Aspergillus cavernicola TaxID=176166 RepID=A0ABR4HG94_9EURO